MRLNDYINYPWDISGLKPGDIVYTIEFYDNEVYFVSRAKVLEIDNYHIYLDKYDNFFDIVFFSKNKKYTPKRILSFNCSNQHTFLCFSLKNPCLSYKINKLLKL